ncbi:MAG TPA: Mur ligase domain-containing protein [Victivallales bacterium]|nr:Mur ligase domain-containing protein [Victivallales bacterium]
MIDINLNYHFIGAGGAGMAPMAIIVKEMGANVSGSDISDSENLNILRKKGIKIFCGKHSPENLPENNDTIVIISSAITSDNPELKKANEKRLRIFRRGEFLAKIAESYQFPIAVAGSHGKTSITGIISYALKKLGFNPGYMIGGKLIGWPQSGSAGDRNIFVTESDESDGTNVFIKPKIGVVSNVDDDHEWNFAGGREELFANFAKFAQNSEFLIYGGGYEADKLFSHHKQKKVVSTRDFQLLPSQFHDFPDFQKLNSLLAAHAINIASEIDLRDILNSICDFPGISRRINRIYHNEKVLLIEDYAHHPAELSALMQYLSKIKSNRKTHIVFQPHRYARLKKYFNEFVEILSGADKITVLPVFSAWCPSDQIDSEKLCQELNRKKNRNFAIFANEDFKSLAIKIISQTRENTIIAEVGAGDCDKLTSCLAEILKKEEVL